MALATAEEPKTQSIPMPSLEEVEAELCRRSLHDFVEGGWHVVESGEFMDSDHIRACCLHLEATVIHKNPRLREKFSPALAHQIQRLLVNIPPRSMKSLLFSVFFPAWVWTFWPEAKFLYASYAQTLSTRDSRKTRALISSQWYQDRFGDGFSLADDNNQVMRFSNTRGGERIATSVGGAVTGDGGDFKILDDPHNILEAESAVARERVHLWRQESWSSRLNDPKTGVDIVIMQRVHEDDVAGRIIKSGGYEHLMIPQEFEPERKCRTSLGWEDPRTRDGELLWPDRNGPEEIAGMKRELGSYAYAGQHQQNPRPRGGGKFKLDWFKGKIVDKAPAAMRSRVRYWDPAATVPKAGTDPDYTAGCKMGEYDGSFYIEDMRHERQSPQGVRNLTKTTAEMDGRTVVIWREQEPGSSGVESSDTYARLLAGYDFHSERVTGSKDVRSNAFAAACENGLVYIVRGDWNQAFLDELCSFPMAKHDDQHDAAAGAFNKLAEKKEFYIA